MKKSLLLPLVASTMIFAGGDIAPVEPVAEAPASECQEFWGSLGFYYESVAFPGQNLFEDSALNRANIAAVLGVEKKLNDWLGFGVEVAGYTTAGLEDALNADWVLVSGATGLDGGELSQLYLTFTYGNTAIKAGRFALDAALSPFVWSDRTGGVLDATFEGVVVANTDIADTTIYGAYLHSFLWSSQRFYFNPLNDDDEFGALALGFINKSITDTTIQGVGYYLPNFPVMDRPLWVLYGSAETKVNDLTVGVQASMVDGDDWYGNDATYAFGAKVAGTFGAVDASVAVSYVNDGDWFLEGLAGYGMLWTDTLYLEAGNNVASGVSVAAILAQLSGKVGIGTLYGALGYWSYDAVGDPDSLGVTLGYSFKVAGIDMKVEYHRVDRSWFVDTIDTVYFEAVYNF